MRERSYMIQVIVRKGFGKQRSLLALKGLLRPSFWKLMHWLILAKIHPTHCSCLSYPSSTSPPPLHLYIPIYGFTNVLHTRLLPHAHKLSHCLHPWSPFLFRCPLYSIPYTHSSHARTYAPFPAISVSMPNMLIELIPFAIFHCPSTCSYPAFYYTCQKAHFPTL